MVEKFTSEYRQNQLVFLPLVREIGCVKPFPYLVLLVLCFFTVPSLHAADTRQDFLKLIDRPRVALDAKVEDLPSTNGLAMFHISFASESGQRVPGILLKPADAHG